MCRLDIVKFMICHCVCVCAVHMHCSVTEMACSWYLSRRPAPHSERRMEAETYSHTQGLYLSDVPQNGQCVYACMRSNRICFFLPGGFTRTYSLLPS